MNLLQVPTTMIGLMGARPRQQNPMLGLMGDGGAPANGGQWGYVGGQDISPDRQLSPEEIDALFLTEQAQQAANGGGQWGYVGGQDITPNRQLTPEEIDGLFLAADPSQMQNAQPAGAQQPLQAMGQAPRRRVSALGVLGRALAPNISGALDSERARLQAEADRPAQQARIQQAMQGMNPVEQALFMGLGSDDWRKNVGQQFAPQVVGEGAAQRVAGSNSVYQNPKTIEYGDNLVRLGVEGPEVVAKRGPTYAEQNVAERNRIDELGAGQSTIGRYRLDSNGNPIFEAPQEYSLGEGQERYVNGERVAENAKAPAGVNAASIRQQTEAIGNTRRAIEDAAGKVGRLSSGVMSGLIPGNQWKADLQADLDTIEANLSFGALQQMRDASTTGGALGSIAIRELELLGSTIASLKTSQSPQQLRRNLGVIEESLKRWEQGLNQSLPARSGVPALPPGFELER